MKIYLILFIFSSFFIPTSFANVIQGHVKDENGKPLEFCTVALHNSSDNFPVKSEITDIDGYFKFTGIKEGEYFIECSFMGYEKNISQKFHTRDIKESFCIHLMPANTKLDELFKSKEVWRTKVHE